MTLEPLVDRYCAIWSSPGPADRAAELNAVLDAAATYTDPTVAPLTRAQLLSRIEQVVAGRPGAVLRRTSAVDAHHGLARFSFEVVAPDGRLLRSGTDFVRVNAAGSHLVEIVGFFDALTTPPAGA